MSQNLTQKYFTLQLFACLGGRATIENLVKVDGFAEGGSAARLFGGTRGPPRWRQAALHQVKAAARWSDGQGVESAGGLRYLGREQHERGRRHAARALCETRPIDPTASRRRHSTHSLRVLLVGAVPRQRRSGCDELDLQRRQSLGADGARQR